MLDAFEGRAEAVAAALLAEMVTHENEGRAVMLERAREVLSHFTRPEPRLRTMSLMEIPDPAYVKRIDNVKARLCFEPRNLADRLLLGTLYGRAGCLRSAAREFERCLEIDSECLEAARYAAIARLKIAQARR
jgi:tRNA isopentenyl-2-thiomethyl-A-37 hydroxylase MiaE